MFHSESFSRQILDIVILTLLNVLLFGEYVATGLIDVVQINRYPLAKVNDILYSESVFIAQFVLHCLMIVSLGTYHGHILNTC